MSKFVKLLLVVFLFGIGSQLLGQDVYDTPEEVDREISKQEQREKRSDFIQQRLAQQKMADFRKWEAAHKRAHMRDGKQHSQCSQCAQRSKRAQISRKNKSKQWIKTLVVGGVAYYVGYKVGQDEMKKSRKGKRPVWMPDREKK